MIFFDAYAIIEVLKGNPKYEKFKKITFITNTLHLAEVFFALLRETDLNTANNIIKNSDFEFIEVSEDIAIDAAIFKQKYKKRNMSYADCIGYISATKKGLIFLTGDKDFSDIDNIEYIKKG